jgi:predicted amidohydrolase
VTSPPSTAFFPPRCTVTIVTCAPECSYDLKDNLERHLAMIDAAASLGASLVIFPEMSLHGYPAHIHSIREERLHWLWGRAECVAESPSVEAIATRAKQRNIHVVFGLNEMGSTWGVVYNTAVLVGPTGILGTYRKVHVSTIEQFMWRPGKDWPVYKTPVGRIGMLICNDKNWPEATRELVLQGADLFVMPTAWLFVTGEADATNHWLELYTMYDRCRAAENQRWFISSNFAGTCEGSRYLGHSEIVDPLGRIVATTGFEPGFAVAEVDIGAGIEEAQASLYGPRLILDRRDDTYVSIRGLVPYAVDG